MLYILLLAIVIVCIFYPVAAIVSCAMCGGVVGWTIFIGALLSIAWGFKTLWEE